MSTGLVLWLACAVAQEPRPLPEVPADDAVDPVTAEPEDPAGPQPAPDVQPAAPAPDPLVDNRAPPPPAAPPPARRRTYELSLRSRYISVPRGLLDLFLISGADPEWPLGATDRPDVLAYSLGLEFGVQQTETTRLGFYVEYIGSLVEEGYWDDRDDPPDGRDGDWLRPSNGFGGIALAFNAFYDAPLVDGEQTRDQFELSFYVGGGIGIVGIVGHMDQWELDPVTGTPAYQKARSGREPDGRLDLGSPVWPMVDFELGFRMIFAEHVILRLGGGLHDGLQLGGNLGARF